MFKKNDQSIDFKDSSVTDNLPVHTMKKDLAKLKDPNFKIDDQNNSVEIENKPLKAKPKTAIPNKTNPFLTPADYQKKSSMVEKTRINQNTQAHPIKKVEKIPIPAKNNLSQLEKKVKTQKKPKGKKTAIIIILTLILVIIGGGGYYFWKTRWQKQANKKESPKVVTKNQNNPVQENQNEPVQENKSSFDFNIDKSNYLILSNQDELKKIIQEDADKIAQSTIITPVEFIVTDAQNNPLSFQSFAQKLGLTLPQNILDQLGKEFSFYIYNDNGQVRSGLVVTAQNSEQLKKLLLAEEEKLPLDLQALFLTTQYTVKEGYVFHSSQYKDVDIRYDNVISPEVLSVDYAITQDKLVIGTTKKTIRVILDLLPPTITNTVETN